MAISFDPKLQMMQNQQHWKAYSHIYNFVFHKVLQIRTFTMSKVSAVASISHDTIHHMRDDQGNKVVEVEQIKKKMLRIFISLFSGSLVKFSLMVRLLELEIYCGIKFLIYKEGR